MKPTNKYTLTYNKQQQKIARKCIKREINKIKTIKIGLLYIGSCKLTS